MLRQNIPNLLTCLNLSCGLLAILSSNPDLGVLLVVTGGIFDVFDGLVARALKVDTKIGGELDSLADIVSFGVAPAILFYREFAVSGEWMYLIGPIFIVVAGAIRLARFNTTESRSSYFEGLAIPASGLLLCGFVLGRDYVAGIGIYLLLFLAICLILAFLNVSKIRMFSFKQIGIIRVKVYFILLAICVIVMLFIAPLLALVSALILYICVAIFEALVFSNGS